MPGAWTSPAMTLWTGGSGMVLPVDVQAQWAGGSTGKAEVTQTNRPCPGSCPCPRATVLCGDLLSSFPGLDLCSHLTAKAHVPSHPSLQRGPFFGGLLAHHVGYTCEASSMIDLEPRLGLISKVSTQHLSGGSPPSSPRDPGKPCRSQQRCTDRPDHTQRQHLNSQT